MLRATSQDHAAKTKELEAIVLEKEELVYLLDILETQNKKLEA